MPTATQAGENAALAVDGPVAAMEVREITKEFGGTIALRNVSLKLFAGEIHALVGENGSGKSTLSKILAGVHSPDEGSLSLDGEQTVFSSPVAAQRAGVSIIFQEPTVFPDLTVAENVFVGRQPRRRLRPWLDRGAMRRDAELLLNSLGVSIDPGRVTRGLSVAELQTVEMASALTRRSRVLIVDEPTASLTPAEVKDLFQVLRNLAEQGVAVLFIGHRLEEVFAIATRITVLRDGGMMSTGLAAQYTEQRVIREMVGRSVEFSERRLKGITADESNVVLAARGLTRRGEFHDIDLTLRLGRVTALAGLVGSGRTEIVEALVGVTSLDKGDVHLAGVPVTISRPVDAQRLGLVLVPEDRQTQGVALDFSIADNIAVPSMRSLSRWGFIDRLAVRAQAALWIEKLGIKAWGPEQRAFELSGGNQQKVSVAKWLSTNPKVLILDEPTRGVDIGAKDDIHRLIDDLLTQGLAVLMISSDLPEVLAVADEIVVIREGRLAGVLPAGASAEDVMSMAVGSGNVSVNVNGEEP